MIIQLMPVILKQRMGNERSLMEFCGVIKDLIIVSFGSKVMVPSLASRSVQRFLAGLNRVTDRQRDRPARYVKEYPASSTACLQCW